MPLEKLTRPRVIEALNLLGQYAEAEQVTLELCVFGGSALMLAYGAREMTKDVDAIARPSDVAQRPAQRVAERLGMHESWLNDDVKRFVLEAGTLAPLEIEELEGIAKRRLKITRPSAGYLLAMKCLACRPGLPGYPGDVADIRFLIRKLGLRTLEQIDEQIERFYPFDALTEQSRAVIEDLLAQSEGEAS